MLNKALFVAILALTAMLRLWDLNNLPPSLNWDEVSIGYNAYSILKTAKDEWGEFLPLSFRAYGDYKLPGYVYLDAPFVAVFGLNEWGVRLPSAILGMLMTILIYTTLISLVNTHAALVGMFFSAITPWNIIISRIALEAHLALVLTAGGFYFFVIGLQKQRYLTISGLLFGLTIFSYNSSRIVTPLLMLTLLVIFRKELFSKLKYASIGFIIFLIFFFIAFPKALLQDSSARYNWTTILDSGAIAQINQSRAESSLDTTFSRLLYNKATYFISHAATNYVSHFSPYFLFIAGGSNYQFSVPGYGLLHLIYLPFLTVGIFYFLKERKKWQIYLLFWLFIAPIPGAITRDAPHALRSLMMIPAIIYIASIGVSKLLTLFSRSYFFLFVIVLWSLTSLAVFLNIYLEDYKKTYSWSWQYGYRQAVGFIKGNSQKYQKIFFTKKYGEPHEFILFYLPVDPLKYQSDDDLLRYEKSDWFWVDKFDKFEFVNDWEIKDKAECSLEYARCLLITSPGNYNSKWRMLDRINFLSGEAVFDILESI